MKTLRAGPLSLIFEETTGSVRRLRVGGHEIVRRIYAAVRDRDWNTVPPRVWNVKIQDNEDSFNISYLARATQGDVDFAWRVSVTGDLRGTLKFRMDGQARADFLRNRVGLCVLHPARGCAGQAASAESPDGGLRRGTFPRYIYPNPPFTNFTKLWYAPAGGPRIRVDFEGELFEMEDQRNWTDASFKSYCTPASVPRPIPTPKGTIVDQTVTVSLEEAVAKPAPAPTSTLTIDARPTHPLPRIGFGLAHRGVVLKPTELEQLAALRPAHLRADLRISAPDWTDVLRRALDESKAAGCQLELAIRLGPDGKSEHLREALKGFSAPVARVLLFQDGQPVIQPARSREARAILSVLLPGVPVGGGSDGHFEQLNAAQPGKEWDLVCWPASPQVHHHDDFTVVENLEGLAATVESARLFSGERPLCVTPVTLLPRAGPGAPGEMGSAPDVDDRQWSLSGAAWTVGAIKRLAEMGTSSATFYETAGSRGVMDREPRPVYPVYHVFADVLELAGGRVVPCRSGDPLSFDGLCVREGSRTRLLIANLSEESRSVTVTPLPARVSVKRISDSAPADVGTSMGRLELALGPWDVVRIDA